MTTTIRAKAYDTTVNQLTEDPIVQAMFAEMQAGRASPLTLAETNGWAFMSGSLKEYERRGGTQAGHIGGVSEALQELERRAITGE